MKIKIGQIGVCHEHAADKIACLRALPDVFEIVGVVDDRKSPSAKFAGDDLQPYEGMTFMSEAALLNTPGLQAVVVETPNADLVSTALRCMEKGVALHMDKPGGDNLDDFAQLRMGYETRGLPFQMGYMLRNNPAIQFAQRYIREGRLGDVFEIQASMSHNYGGADYQEYLGEFQGGIMLNLGCHVIDFIIAMMGRPLQIAPYLRSTAGVPDTIANNCLAILEYPHALVSVRACSMEVEGVPHRRLKICGTKGTLDLCPIERFDGQPLQMCLSLSEANDEYTVGTHVIDFGIQKNRYREQLLEFAKMIWGEFTSPYDYQHDYLVQDVLLACTENKKWRD